MVLPRKYTVPFCMSKEENMAEKPIDLGLGRAYDELFTSQEERDDQKREKIIDIPLSELHTFKNHPFR